MSPAVWRKWHRWVGFPAALFLLYASVTGLLLAGREFFSEEEELREKTRALVSPATLPVPPALWSEPLARAFAAAADQAGGAPVDRVTLEFKGDPPTITVYTGRPDGGEDRKFVCDAGTGAVLRVESYTDKPFLLRLHSGEAWGDGGLVVAMFWGAALTLLTVTGVVIYLRMWRPGLTGLRRVFWLVLACTLAAPPAHAGTPGSAGPAYGFGLSPLPAGAGAAPSARIMITVTTGLSLGLALPR
jgi:uncharacterized iron-regulated membrane protein